MRTHFYIHKFMLYALWKFYNIIFLSYYLNPYLFIRPTHDLSIQREMGKIY